MRFIKTEKIQTHLINNRFRLQSKPFLYLIAASLMGVIVILSLTGCSLTPKIYKMQPDDLEKIRSDLGNIGLSISSYQPKGKTNKPAKGVIGGASRGFVVGASLPVVIGFVTPVPGTTPMGAMIAPFTGVAGAVYGTTKGVAAEDIEKAEAAADIAVIKLRDMQFRKELVNELVKLGKERAGLDFINLSEKGPGDPKEVVRYDRMDLHGVDTVLELRIENFGLWGLYSFDPPSLAFVELDIRLIRTHDNEVVIKETFFCGSEQKKNYLEWAGNEGQLFIDEFLICLTEIAEKIVDDLFLVYPIPSR